MGPRPMTVGGREFPLVCSAPIRFAHAARPHRGAAVGGWGCYDAPTRKGVEQSEQPSHRSVRGRACEFCKA